MSTANIDIQRKDNASFFQLLTQHPTGFWFIFWGEFAERCSYYGMRAILATYMADRLGLGKENAGLYMSFFIAACYFLPLLGGFLADNYFGKYNIIVAFSIPYILGHVILGIENQYAVVTALALLAMGSGVIKPNISTLMGLTYDQQRPGQDLLRTQAFSMFYLSINIGAFISQVSIPWIKENYGYFNAFLFPAVLMVVAFIFFAIGKKHYAVEKIERRPATPEEATLRWSVLGQVGMLFLLVMFFWAIFDQSASTWIFYAQTYMKADFFLTAEQMQSINPLLIVAFLPLVNALFTSMANSGWNIRATDKIAVGFVLTAATMGIMAYCGYQTGQADRVQKVDSNGVAEVDASGAPVMVDQLPESKKVSLWWQAIAYFTLTIAEILISVTGLELAFVAAPKNMKSFVTSLWLLTVALANLLLNAPLSQFYPRMHPGNYFAMLAGMMLVVILVFYFVARRFNRVVEAQKQAEREMTPDEEVIARELPPTGVASGNDGIQPAWKRDGVQ
ncbi:MAG: oligopeptide:H+ symporter [Gemmataceae bacterium]|nr:oligopeptide:H+ symporter [Gemmataceae bacterium]